MQMDDSAITGLTERDLDFEAIPVHCWDGGRGAGVLLLHGSGAGAATLSNFRRVLGPLSREFHVLAADLVGFGQSGLKEVPPYFDMELWVRQLRWLLDQGLGEDVIVIGHSLSGAIALKAAASDRRIGAVVTTGTMGVAPTDGRSGPRWRFPASRAEVQQAVERTFYDKSYAEPAEVERRLRVLNRPGYREYFESMFDGPRETYVEASALTAAELRSIRCPVVLMHGADDASFSPQESSIALARDIDEADVYVLSRCAHSVAHERPQELLGVVRTLAARIAERSSQVPGPDGRWHVDVADEGVGAR